MKKWALISCFIFIVSGGAAQTALLDSLQQIISQNNFDTTHANALFSMGVNLERSDLKMSIKTYRNLLGMREDPSFDRVKGQAAIRLGGNYSAVGNVDSVGYYFGLAETYLTARPDDQKFAYNYHNGLGIHYNRIGNHAEALINYQKAAALDPDIIGLDNVAGLHLNMANLYSGMDDQKSRMESSYKALEIFEKTQNKVGLAFVYNSLGNLFYSLKDYEKSEKNYLKSLEYRKLSGDRRGEAVIFGNLGTVFTDKGAFEDAITYLSEAMVINEELGLKENIGLNLINLGKNYEKLKEYSLSLQCFQKAKDLLKEAGIDKHDAVILADMGKLQSILNQQEEAYQSLLAATSVATGQKNHSNAITAYKNLKEYYQAQGKFQEALEAQTNEFAHRDSLGIGGLQTQLKELESKFALDIKENEISLLKAEKELDKAELAKRKANQNLIIAVFVFLILIAGVLVNKFRVIGRTKRLLEVEKLRNSIARDLHDDLGSTLSSIQILSQMALQKEDASNKTIFTKINTQTASMMDKLGDIVWSIHPNNDNVDQLLNKMQEFAGEILEPKEIAYSFDITERASEVKLDPERRRSIFLIFKEAVNNAAKYAESKHLQIRLEVVNGELVLFIKDDGKGFDMNTIKKGNGLFNMHQRAEMLGGNMIIHSLPNSGTSIHLRAPIT